MPEDLRAKEESLLAKKKGDYDLDLTAPGGQPQRAKTSKLSGSSIPWWQRLADIFSRSRKRIPPDKKESALTGAVKNNGQDQGWPGSPLDIEERESLQYDDKKLKTTAKSAPLPEKETKEPKPKVYQPERRLEPNPASEVVIKTTLPVLPKIVSPAPDTAPADFKLPALPKVEKYQATPAPLAPTPPPSPVLTPTAKLTPSAHSPYFPKRDFSMPVEIPRSAAAPTKPVTPRPPLPAPAAAPSRPEPVAKEKGLKFHQPEPRIRARFLDNDGGVDLIPAASRLRTSGQIGGLALIVFFIALLVVGLFYGTLYYQKEIIKKQISNRSEEIADLEQEILSFTDLNQEIRSLGDNIKLFNGILSRHIYWNNFFNLLEKYTVKEVYYKGFSAGSDGALTLTAIGPNFDAVARQLRVLQQDGAREFVSQAQISSAKLTDYGVEFSVVVVLNSGLFYYKE